jgi:T5SS/PEP-CTERM-associated repeat protein/autotransporter-associated beta strand protein
MPRTGANFAREVALISKEQASPSFCLDGVHHPQSIASPAPISALPDIRIPFAKALLLLATALAGTLGAGAAQAACTAAFCWNAPEGIWSNGANWTPGGGPPTTATGVVIGNGGTATVDTTNAQSGTATIVGNSSVIISPGGTWTAGGAVNLGDTTGNGTLTVNGGTLTVNETGSSTLGFFGSSTGSMLIENGGVVTMTAGVEIGSTGTNTSNGIVTLTGAGSSWTLGGNLDLENPGTSTGVTVENGASLVSGQAFIGAGGAAGSSNNMLVTGAGTTWQASNIVLGGFFNAGPGSATGTVDITDGAAVSATGAVAIGYSPDGGNGLRDAVTVDGSGSKLTGAGPLYAGYYGAGALTISDGAEISDITGIIAYSSTDAAAASSKFLGAATPTNSVGSVLVTGPGSEWMNTSLIVGDNATVAGLTGSGTGTSIATLTVADGGEVGSTNAIVVGANAGATGTINIGAAAGEAAGAPGTLSTPAIQFGAGEGAIVFNHTSTDYVFAIPIEGAGALDVEGGTTVLTATNTYTGATTINGGTLDVAGALTGSSGVMVNNGGTLEGPGSITAPVAINSGGTFAPGTAGVSGSAATITGSLAFQSGAFYAITVSPVGATMANVSGTASLAGTVETTLAPGVSLAKASTYDILHSGGLGGTVFGGAASMPNLATSLSYSPTDVFLTVTAAQLGESTALNSNQLSAANALNRFFNRGGTLPSGFVDLYRLTGGALGDALTQASGEVATGAQQTTFDAMSEFINLLADPFMGRGNGSAAPAYADNGADAHAANKQYYALFTKDPVVRAYEPRWSVWAAGYGGSQSTDGNAATGSNNTTSHIAGTAVGADYLVSPNTIAGFALAGGGTNFSVSNLGSGRSDLFQAGAYVRYTNGGAYITGAIAYGWQDITTNRNLTIGGSANLHAAFNANAWSGRAESGYRFVAPSVGGVGITPYAAAQFTTFDLPAYVESATYGAPNFALNYGAQSVTDARSELGFRSDKSFAMPGGVLTLYGRVAWAHDFDPDRAVVATFQSLPGASFVVNGAAQAPESALTSASVEMKWLNGWSAAVTFDGEFSSATASYAGRGELRYVW